MYHIVFQNGIEKIFCQTYFPYYDVKRPLESCKTKTSNSVYCIGMPSGHAQSSFFSVIFIYLALKDIKIIIVYLFIALITMYQRVLFKQHTVLQVSAGAIVGVLFGGFIYYMAQQKIIGKLRFKKDDNGPI